MGDYDPVRDRMERSSEAELRGVVADIDGWSLEARVAAHAELVRRGVTDVPDPSTTSYHVERSVDSSPNPNPKSNFYFWLLPFAIAVTLLRWLLE